jgi:TP901 family phage tail tape measure protein
MEEFVRVTALLGVTTDLTAEQAADSLGILGNVLHLTGEDYDNFASSLVALGNAGASTESQIIAIAERAGAAADLIGISADQVLGFSSAVASLGIEPEAGGTALQKFFIDTAGFIAEGGDELETFAKISGTSAKQIKRNFDKDAGGALKRFLANLGKLSQGEQIRALRELGFNDARITRTLLGLANNTALVTEQTELATKAYKENTALTKEAEQRFKTFDSQLQITKNVLTDIGITIGSKLLPKLTPLLKRLNDFINGHQADIEKFGDDLAGGFEKVADAVGKTDWTPFIDGLKLSASLAKGAFDAFNALPDDFKKLVLVGFGINKFTGGLITSLGKDVAGALGGQFLGRGSSPANPLWVQSVGGIGGVGGAAGAGSRGALATVGKAASLVLAPAAALIIGTEIAEAIGLIAPPSAQDEARLGPLAAILTTHNEKLIGHVDTAGHVSAERQNIANERLESIRAAAEAQKVKADALNAKFDKNVTATNAIKAAVDAAKAAEVHANQQTAAAVRDKDLSVSVSVPVSVKTNVTVRETINQQTTYKKYYTVAS